MTNDRQARIREHIKTIDTIHDSLQDILTEEETAWCNTPRTLKTDTRYFNHLEIVADLSAAILSMEHSVVELDSVLRR